MELQRKRTTITEIIANQAPVFVYAQHASFYTRHSEIRKKKVVGALYRPNGALVKLLLSDNMKPTIGDQVMHITPHDRIYASVDDLVNENPISIDSLSSDEVDKMSADYLLPERLYFIGHRDKVDFVSKSSQVEHINLVTGDVVYLNTNTEFFDTEKEAMASRPDLFPPKVKVKVTRTITTEVDSEEEAQRLIERADDYEALAVDEIHTEAEIVD